MEPTDIRDNEEKSEEIKAAEESASQIFDKHKTGPERVDDILSKIKPVLDSGLFDKEGILQQLNECAGDEKGEFVRKSILALAPILELRARDPEVFKNLNRSNETEREHEKFIELNKNFSYNQIENKGGEKSFLIHLPVKPEGGKKQSDMEIGRMFKDGLQKLAEITSNEPDIKKIEATSKLVKKYQRLMDKMGFTVTGAIGEELRVAHFTHERPGEVWHSEISREEFIKKYLKK